MLITYEVKNHHIAIITLNRPEAANALSKKMLGELNNLVNRIEQDKAIYCVIITGSGEKAFCAGADLKERIGMTDEQVIEAVQYIGQTVDNIAGIKVPVIAAINSAAFGGGLELALACDIRIAHSASRLGLTETSLAIIPGAGGTQRLPRLIGLGQAKKLIYTAKPVTAIEALDIGLVEQITDANVLVTAVDMAKQIVGNGPIALKQAKKAINQGMETDLTHGITLEHEYYQVTISTEDRTEGLVAFKEKRKPNYQAK